MTDTRLNPHFTRSPNEQLEPDFQLPVPLPEEPAYAPYLRNSLAASSQQQYLIDLKDFEAWGGSLPASAETIASFIADRAQTLAVATITRRLTGLSKVHDARGLPNPVRTELVRATMKGIRRHRGTAQRMATPMMRETLFDVLKAIGDRPKDKRDKALLLIGFATAMRRSELVALTVDDVETVRQGLIVHVRRSKTDQEAEGRRIAVPFGRTQWCPVRFLEDWLSITKITEGPIFRRVDWCGKISALAMKPEAVSIVVRERVAAVGLYPESYSGHSLRAGLASSAAEAGIASWAIRRTTGHRSQEMLERYIRVGDLFRHNAAGSLL
ncbi:MAG: tyrosine-type recombinase/integrase [Proteobacteria bacterium]|nr:tyrosine-type recombinase/integrase [Pseudomonadota bacterium]